MNQPAEVNVGYSSTPTHDGPGAGAAGPYARTAQAYRDAGWLGVLPVVGKHPPPAGYTGLDGAWPTTAQVTSWRAQRGHDNVALRLPPDVIGIDVDAYDGRNGLRTLEHFEERFGALPPTWRSTSRTDESGIRLYRVPLGEHFVSALGRDSHVEIIRTGHRYAVVAPSRHPVTSRSYLWYGPDGRPTSRSPRPEELPELPPEWVAALRRVGGAHVTGRDGHTHRDDPIGVVDHEGAPVDPEAIFTEGVPPGEQNTELFRYVCSLRRRRVHPTEMLILTNAALQTMPNEVGREPWTPADASAMVERVCRTYPPGSDWDVSPAQAEFAASLRGAPVVEAPNDPATELTTRRLVAEVGTGPGNPHRATDRANGIEVARFLDGRALWTPEAGWHVYDGRRWAPDAERVTQLLVGEYTDLLRERATSGLVGREAETFMARANRIESVAGLRGALEFAGPRLAHLVTTLDADPWLLNCPNGTLDLRAGELLAHDPRHLLSRVCPTPYDPEARDATWERVLREALEDDPERLRLLARFAGYTLTGRTTEKRMLVINGPTNTGKSTVTEPLYRALGDVSVGGYATTWDADVVQADSRVNRGEKLAKARGARLVLVGELEKGSRMADSFVKQFTGGDTMDAKQLYRDSFSYRPSAKLWMVTNYVPRSPDRALQERLLLLPFEREPVTKDPGVKAYLDDDERARRAVLAWAVRACAEWRAGGLGETPWLAQRRERYARASDPVVDFIEETLDVVEGYESSSDAVEVWRVYLAWAADNVRRGLTKRGLADALEERGHPKKRGAHGAGAWRFVGLRTQR